MTGNGVSGGGLLPSFSIKGHFFKKPCQFTINSEEKGYLMEHQETRKMYSIDESTKSFSNNKDLQDEIQNFFNNDQLGKENTSKSFIMLLLDPRITDNIPANADIMQPFQSGLYLNFRKAIFFVGTGKRQNIHSHLKNAQCLWKKKISESPNPTIQHIFDIWSENYGVISLQVFETSRLEESITYRGAINDFIGPSNLKNEEDVQCHDDMAGWPEQMRRELGSCLLSDAFVIYVNSGERQLRPENI